MTDAVPLRPTVVEVVKQGPQGPAIGDWRGAWAAGSYRRRSLVEKDGSTWLAIRDTSGEPGESVDWQVLLDGTGAAADREAAENAAAIAVPAGEAAVAAAEIVVPLAAQVDADAAAVELSRAEVETNTAVVAADKTAAETAQAAAEGARDDAETARDQAQQAVANPSVAYDTLSSLNADLAHGAGTVGQVLADGANNGFYVKVGASGSGSWSKKSGATVPGLQSQVVAADLGVEALKAISTVQTRGTPDAPASDTPLGNNSPYIFDVPVSAGYVTEVAGYALAAGNLILKRFTKSGAVGVVSIGDVFTQVGSDVSVPVSAGSFTLGPRDIQSMKCNEGEWIGFYGYGLIGRSSPSASPTVIHNAGASPVGNVSSLTVGATSTNAKVQLRIRLSSVASDILSRVGAVEATERNTLAALEDALLQIGHYTPGIPLSRLSGFWLDFTDKAQLFSDTDLSVQVAKPGDLITRAKDKSGQGFNFRVNSDVDAAPWAEGRDEEYPPTEAPSFGYLHLDNVKGYLTALKGGLVQSVSRMVVLTVTKQDEYAGTRPTIEFARGSSGYEMRAAAGIKGVVTAGGSFGWPSATGRQTDAGTVYSAYAKQPRGSLVFGAPALNLYDYNFAAGEFVAAHNGEIGIEGVATFTPGVSAATAHTYTWIGDREAVAGTKLIGDVYEIVVLIDPTDNDVERVHMGLASKYGLDVLSPPERYDPGGLLPGAWTWFCDPRVWAISADRYVVGSVSPAGSYLIGDYDFSGEPTFTHHNLTGLQNQDDHNNWSFARRSDGRLVAACTGHDTPYYFIAISTNVDDPSSWSEPVNIASQIAPGSNYYWTYSNLVYLEDEERLYLFIRGHQTTSSVFTWGYTTSDDGGITWAQWKPIFPNQRPYTRVWKTSGTRIDITNNTGHPDEIVNCSTLHMYYEGGNLYRTDGTLIGPLSGGPYDYTSETMIWDAAANGGQESWVNAVIFAAGAPHVLFTTYSTDESAVDHTLRRASWNGSAWMVETVATLGGSVYPDRASNNPSVDLNNRQRCYNGGACFHPTDPDIVWCGRQVNALGAIGTTDDYIHHIYKMARSGPGAWAAERLTTGNTRREMCMRPYAPAGGDRVFFIRGRYDSYYDFDTTVDSMPIA